MGVPKGKEDHRRPTIAAGDGFFAKLAQKAAGFAFDKAIDVYFGEGPARKSTPARCSASTAKNSPASSSWRTTRTRARASCRRDSRRRSSTPRTTRRRSCPTRIARGSCCGRTASRSRGWNAFRDINELEGFVRAGVALTRDIKFARPFVTIRLSRMLLLHERHFPQLDALLRLFAVQAPPPRSFRRRPTRSRLFQTPNTCRRAPARARSR